MKILIIGDVHGCYHTLKSLVDKHWKPEEQVLVQLGDLINKGPFSGKCIRYWQELEKANPGRTVLLRGNHEQSLINHYTGKNPLPELKPLVDNITAEGLSLKKVCEWLAIKGLRWETEGVLITHAGISKNADDPFEISSKKGVLNNRSSLRRLEKVQVVGHTMVQGGKPVFNPRENAWFIDTGAWTRKYLSALIISEDGTEAKVIREARSKND